MAEISQNNTKPKQKLDSLDYIPDPKVWLKVANFYF